MTKKMLKKIGTSFRESVDGSLELGEIIQKHISSLRSVKSTDEDSKQLALYLKQLELSYQERLETKKITDLLEDIVFTMFKYVIYLNEVSETNVFITISSRKKCLVSELCKIVRNIMLGKSGTIKDRFALRYIIENDADDEKLNIELLYQITNSFIELMCYETNTRKQFLDWCATTMGKVELDRINKVLSIQFVLFDADNPKDTYNRFYSENGNPPKALRFSTPEQIRLVVPELCGIDPAYFFGVKDYVYDPKKRGYQSLHFILYIPSTSPILPGLFIEIQGRTRRMDINAEDPNSPAYHGYYKENSVDEDIVNTFYVDPNTVCLKGFDFRPAPKPTAKQVEDGKIPQDYMRDRVGLISPIFPNVRSNLSA